MNTRTNWTGSSRKTSNSGNHRGVTPPQQLQTFPSYYQQQKYNWNCDNNTRDQQKCFKNVSPIHRYKASDCIEKSIEQITFLFSRFNKTLELCHISINKLTSVCNCLFLWFEKPKKYCRHHYFLYTPSLDTSKDAHCQNFATNFRRSNIFSEQKWWEFHRYNLNLDSHTVQAL